MDGVTKIFATILIAVIGLVCVIICDYLLLKISSHGYFVRLISKEYSRMALSYLCGISIFLVGLKILNLFL